MNVRINLNYKYRIFILILCISGISLSTADTFTILPKPTKVSDHVYAWIGPHGGPNEKNKGFRMNLAFVVGKHSVAVIETGFYPAMAKEMLGRIREITQLPIKYAINSNSQPDRFFGNSVFEKTGAKIIAHKKEIIRMSEFDSNFAIFIENSMKFEEDSVKIPNSPNMPINDNVIIDLGGGTILNISHYKAGHTPAPLIIYIPSDNIVYAGDILYSKRLLAIVPGGNIKEWIETYDYLRQFKNAIFIPGHGKPGPLDQFEKSTYSYLKLLNSYMNKMVDEGVDMQDAINNFIPLQNKYAYLEDFEALAGRNANRAYQEAERAAFE